MIRPRSSDLSFFGQSPASTKSAKRDEHDKSRSTKTQCNPWILEASPPIRDCRDGYDGDQRHPFGIGSQIENHFG